MKTKTKKFIFVTLAFLIFIIFLGESVMAADPIGFHDSSAQSCLVRGWTCDPDKFSQQLAVKFFVGNTSVGQTTANSYRESAVGDLCGGFNQHGFTYTFPYDSHLRDGKTYEITVKAEDISSTGQETGQLKTLSETPRTISCPLGGLEGDVFKDGRVDMNDLSMVAQDFGKTNNFNLMADLNQDNEIDLFDLIGVARHFGDRTKFGIFYSTWHCPASDQVYDISEAIEGNQSWGPIGAFHYWDKPRLGYYCLSRDEEVLREHAYMLRDAGIDFVFLDISNHAYTDSRSDRPNIMIMDPFEKMLEVWSGVENAPKIVPWVPVVVDGDMVDYLLGKLREHPDRQFNYLNKPLILVVDSGGDQNLYPIDENKLAQLEEEYTVRRMWAFYSVPGEGWSFLEQCATSFREKQGDQVCIQRYSVLNEKIEQISITAAYQETYMSNKITAVPKFQGKTFQKQFETLFDNPSVPIATITGWNEWIAPRYCLDSLGMATLTGCSEENDHFPDGSKVFIDEYDVEYSRDIEPADNEMRDYYYQLMKSCIKLFRDGKECNDSTADELCCKDYVA